MTTIGAGALAAAVRRTKRRQDALRAARRKAVQRRAAQRTRRRAVVTAAFALGIALIVAGIWLRPASQLQPSSIEVTVLSVGVTLIAVTALVSATFSLALRADIAGKLGISVTMILIGAMLAALAAGAAGAGAAVLVLRATLKAEQKLTVKLQCDSECPQPRKKALTDTLDCGKPLRSIGPFETLLPAPGPAGPASPLERQGVATVESVVGDLQGAVRRVPDRNLGAVLLIGSTDARRIVPHQPSRPGAHHDNASLANRRASWVRDEMLRQWPSAPPIAILNDSEAVAARLVPFDTRGKNSEGAERRVYVCAIWHDIKK